VRTYKVEIQIPELQHVPLDEALARWREVPISMVKVSASGQTIAKDRLLEQHCLVSITSVRDKKTTKFSFNKRYLDMCKWQLSAQQVADKALIAFFRLA
jgi:hypothetical protein